MTNQNVVNWLKTVTDIGDGISASAIDESKSRYIGVYDPKNSEKQRICIGGKQNTKYQIKKAIILVHWTNNPTVAESKALEISRLLHGISDTEIDGIKVIAVTASVPVWAGRDVKSVCEYIVNAEFKYERDDK